eukprot:714047-Hanusia_phi.AAC.1
MITLLSEIVQGVPGLNALRLIRIFKMVRVFRCVGVAEAFWCGGGGRVRVAELVYVKQQTMSNFNKT